MFVIFFLFRELEKVKTLLIEYEKVKEAEDNFQKQCEVQMEKYQEEIKYLIII